MPIPCAATAVWALRAAEGVDDVIVYLAVLSAVANVPLWITIWLVKYGAFALLIHRLVANSSHALRLCFRLLPVVFS